MCPHGDDPAVAHALACAHKLADRLTAGYLRQPRRDDECHASPRPALEPENTLPVSWSGF
jgi:hypothetical protein